MKLLVRLTTVLALVATVASAHSEKESTTPVDGARLTETPPKIQMVFDEPMRLTMVRLLNDDGIEMPMDRVKNLDPAKDFQAEPEPLPPGQYRVEWRGLAADGHAMSGSFTFRVIE